MLSVIILSGLELFSFRWLFSAQYALRTKWSAIGRTSVFWSEHLIPNPARASGSHYHHACNGDQNSFRCRHKCKFLVTTYLKLIILCEKCNNPRLLQIAETQSQLAVDSLQFAVKTNCQLTTDNW